MEVRCLTPEDAWDLFAKKVGEITLGSHPDIPTLATTVAKKCRGLPLALNVIGETMAYKRTVQEWRLAIDVLTSSAAEFSGMEDEILPILKYSYDNLKSEQLKQCFQYCTLFPEDHNIEKDELVDYWIGEGFIDGNKGRAENQGYEIIGNLLRSCLLMEENQETVKMHDVVREMALCPKGWQSCTRVLRIENLDPQSSEISFVSTMDNLRELHLAHSNISEIKVLPPHIPTTTPFFPNLSQVSLEFCKGLRDLTWLIFAPNLTVLRVISASQLEELINKEKAEQQNLIPFQELKELRLENVTMLKSIHQSPLPFPCLQKILVNGCSELRKLPLSFTSVPRGDLVIEAHNNWIEILEWEDEATKARFLPSFKAFPETVDTDGI